MATRTDLVTPSSRTGSGVAFAEKSGIHQESSTARHKVGTRLKLDDGRTFYYAKNGSTAVNRPGVLLSGVSMLVTEKDTNLTTAQAIGDKEIGYTSVGTFTRSELADGYFTVVAGTGRGQMYKIRDNTAMAASAGTIYLYDPLVTALDTTSDVVVTPSPFRHVKRDGAATAWTLGTNLIPLTAAYYFWLQTYGWASVLINIKEGEVNTERILFKHASGISGLVTAGGDVGASPLGSFVYDSADVPAAKDWALVHLDIWP